MPTSQDWIRKRDQEAGEGVEEPGAERSELLRTKGDPLFQRMRSDLMRFKRGGGEDKSSIAGLAERSAFLKGKHTEFF